jgi:hypothetical protein
MGGDAYRGGQEVDGAPSAALRAGGGDALSAPLAWRSLLNGAIDYAGLFPPASLGMAAAVSEYERHRRAPDNWALGRFVVPLSRWSELESYVSKLPESDAWSLSVLAMPTDAARLREIRGGNPRLVVQAVECKTATIDDVAGLGELVSAGMDVFAELSVSADFDALAVALKRVGASAKIRTGGVTANAFPSSPEVLRFLRACLNAGVRFKATAGLHHAVRGEYRLTYEPSPPVGTMFGFLNVALAAALLRFGRDDETVIAVLEERAPDAFEFTDTGVSWRDERLTLRELDEVRAAFFVGFGSCSFSEPMAEVGLQALPQA